MEDDFISAINHAVKEEIVQGFFRERCILQEEEAEFNEFVARFEEERILLAQSLAKLRGVLALPEQWDAFWSRALNRTEDIPRLDGPTELPTWPDCRGWTWSRRYAKLVKAIAQDLWASADRLRNLKTDLDSLAEEISGDIAKFERNFDVLAITGFLRQLDVETLAKRYELASCLDGQACLVLDQSLRFRRPVAPAWGEWAWAANLGPERMFVDAAGDAARSWARSQTRAVKAMLTERPENRV